MVRFSAHRYAVRLPLKKKIGGGTEKYRNRIEVTPYAEHSLLHRRADRPPERA